MPPEMESEISGPFNKKKSNKKYIILSHFRIFCSMARPSEHSLGYEVLNSPPSIYGAEVSAEWKRTRKGEVIMTVRMPLDAVDSEIYIKTPRGHSGISMDPWTSSTWSKKWNTYHTTNQVTKDKLNKFNQERTHRCFSLHRTAGRQKQFRNS